MAKLKLGAIEDDKPVRLTLDLPAPLHRDLVAYGRILGGATPVEPVKLVGPMLERFLASDRGFASIKRNRAGEPKAES
jgi:hypothetical protein